MLIGGLILYGIIGLIWTLVDWGEFFQRPTWYDLLRIVTAMIWWPLSMVQEFWWRPRQRRKRAAQASKDEMVK